MYFFITVFFFDGVLPCRNRFVLRPRLDELSTVPSNGSYSSSDDILHFIRRHGYMIVPSSNPPSQFQGRRTERKTSIYTGRCPFTFEVEDFVDTVPRFLSNAICRGCDDRCEPISYTQQLLRRKCGNYWLWEEQEVRVAYVFEQ